MVSELGKPIGSRVQVNSKLGLLCTEIDASAIKESRNGNRTTKIKIILKKKTEETEERKGE